ncbi:MAG: RHS repeat-associated core domain-containing protein, partial [Oscillospiraceae bacterium]|nr:RHS repeat-associated core domain-containing protein [Oscillospiraceae bacterium]
MGIILLPGYYPAADTGFYYLQSRYYDPAIGRFINADALVSTGTGVLGFNMFAYCNNNPASSSDPTGTCPSCAAARNSDQIMTDVLCGFGGGSSLTLAGSAVAVGSVVQVVAQAQTLATTQEPKI